METEKQKLMRILNITEAEAQEVLDYDKAVDKGKPTKYDLTEEQQKEVSKMTRAKNPTVYNFKQKREHKVNITKADLIEFLKTALENYDCQNLAVLNPERQIAFSVGENDYELTLTQKRKKKS